MFRYHRILWYHKALSFLTPLVLIFVAGIVSAQSVKDKDCTAYYETRVANLLGCCGDVKQDYRGTDVDRASAALTEIGTAAQQPCVNHKAPEYLALMLDRAGAHLMRARALIQNSDPTSEVTTLQRASMDADTAYKIVETFSHDHPVESSQIWPWIAEALLNAGRPWNSLVFLSKLDPKCCESTLLAEFKGRGFFQLSAYAAASKSYSLWIADKHSKPCHSEISLNNIQELRRRGFDLPDINDQMSTCITTLGWAPYIRFPASGG